MPLLTLAIHLLIALLWLPGLFVTAWWESQAEAFDRATDWRIGTRMWGKVKR